MNRTPALLVILLLAVPWPAQADLDLETLMRHLAGTAQARTPFREEKTLALLDQPLVLEGILEYRAPDYLKKDILQPYQESYEVQGDQVLIQRPVGENREGAGLGQTRLSLRDYPPLRAFVASLLATLNGDLGTLRRYYRLALEGDLQDWTLQLLPLDPAMAEQVAELTLRGRGGRILSIETQETGGDSSVLRLLDPGP